MSHEYSDIPEVKVDSTGHRYTELPADETQRPELAPGSTHRNGSVAVAAEANYAALPHYTQDALDAGMDSPLFPAPEASESSRQQQNNNSAVKQRHPADMEQEI